MIQIWKLQPHFSLWPTNVESCGELLYFPVLSISAVIVYSVCVCMGAHARTHAGTQALQVVKTFQHSFLIKTLKVPIDNMQPQVNSFGTPQPLNVASLGSLLYLFHPGPQVGIYIGSFLFFCFFYKFIMTDDRCKICWYNNHLG